MLGHPESPHLRRQGVCSISVKKTVASNDKILADGRRNLVGSCALSSEDL